MHPLGVNTYFGFRAQEGAGALVMESKLLNGELYVVVEQPTVNLQSEQPHG